MTTQKPAGIDADGYILTVVDGPIQPQFQPLLTDICATLSRPELGLHGIY
ncbi:MAG: nucleotidyltransferase domain-containing protein, partial [Pseudomonas sp.]|nr:nucleotidyltransferase domain-containing protein [Pseudomonas sp.]